MAYTVCLYQCTVAIPRAVAKINDYPDAHAQALSGRSRPHVQPSRPIDGRSTCTWLNENGTDVSLYFPSYMPNNHSAPLDRYSIWIGRVSVLAMTWQLFTDTSLPYVIVNMVTSYTRVDRKPLHSSVNSEGTAASSISICKHMAEGPCTVPYALSLD